jgi:hypothetical protein
MATIATQRIPAHKLGARTIGLVLAAVTGIAAGTAVMVETITSDRETADRTASASFLVEGVQQSRAINESVSNPTSPAESGRSARIKTATKWMEGLAAGLILPRDVTLRLQQQQPKVARIVMAGWLASSSVNQGVLDARALNAPAAVEAESVTHGPLAGIADARTLNESYVVTKYSPSLKAIHDSRALNEPHVASPRMCTSPTVDDC